MNGDLRVSSGVDRADLPCNRHSQTPQHMPMQWVSSVFWSNERRGNPPAPHKARGSSSLALNRFRNRLFGIPLPQVADEMITCHLTWMHGLGVYKRLNAVFFLCAPGIHSPGCRESFVDGWVIGVPSFSFFLLNVLHGCLWKPCQWMAPLSGADEQIVGSDSPNSIPFLCQFGRLRYHSPVLPMPPGRNSNAPLHCGQDSPNFFWYRASVCFLSPSLLLWPHESAALSLPKWFTSS